MTSTPVRAVAGTGALPAGRPRRGQFGVLVLFESLRLARHPVLLAGTVLGVVGTTSALVRSAGPATDEAFALPDVASTVGVAAMLSACYLTRSFSRAEELVEASPTSTTSRTAALCVTAVVPALVAVLWLVLYYGVRPAALAAPGWMYGTFSHADIAAVLVGNSVVAAVGGALLGVAAGRWWGFRASSAVLVLAVVVWTMGVLGAFSSSDTAPAAWTRWFRLFAPFGYFTSTAPENASVMSLTGSPRWYLAWLVTLCALAAVAALLWRSEGRTRRRVIRAGAVTLALSMLAYGLAVSGGLSQPVRTFPDGHSVVVTR
ncbi:hypothetical protein GCM10009740_37850 [Terrabacter terrae]|uniref:ABC transporter permease n=1 Tax=Terrabacter terrae TaxID=318434 RepID=A0ABN1ZMW6_9MICO